MTTYLSRLWYRLVRHLLMLDLQWRMHWNGTTWEEEIARVEREIAWLESRA